MTILDTIAYALLILVGWTLAGVALCVLWALRRAAQERRVLELLKPGVELYGHEIRQYASLSRGGVYVLLADMEAHGRIVSRPEDRQPALEALGMLPRRIYRRSSP